MTGALLCTDTGSGADAPAFVRGQAHEAHTGHLPHRSMIVCEPWAFRFKAAQEGIVLAQRKRFELRISDEDRDRLRALAERQATTEAAALRALIREAQSEERDERRAGQEVAVAA